MKRNDVVVAHIDASVLKWAPILNALKDYLGRKLTPDEEYALADLVMKWELK
jgi:hypothetical protein